MRHKERVVVLREAHRKMSDAIGKSNPEKLPRDVNVPKLEAAYESLKDYEFVLKKRKKR